jgi:nucleoside diphosphate kinase
MMPLETVLTPNEVKHRFYRDDADFLSAVEAAFGRWGGASRIAGWLWNAAALILRPDAIAGGQAGYVFPMLRRHGFEPLVVRAVHVGAARAEALWRYQFNVATPERRALLGRVMSMGEALYLIVRDRTTRMCAPATVHLTYLKGTAVISRRKPGHLRTVAGPAVANLLSYVHVSDDPADMLREMAVLFDRVAVVEILTELEAGIDRTGAAMREIRRLETLVPTDVLTLEDAALAMAHLGQHGLALWSEWRDIVARAKTCRSFVTGESYAGRDATIPDDKELSLPLDAHLVFPELGPR